MRRATCFAVVLFVGLAGGGMLPAQVGTEAAILGTITDATGAGVPGAEIPMAFT